MATRRFKEGVFDHGAQFFTVRQTLFQRWVDFWIQKGAAQEWTHNFATLDKVPQEVGHARYRGMSGMTSIAKEIAQGLNIHLQTRVESVSKNGDTWIVQTDAGEKFHANHLILTAPVPQSLRLLEAGGVSLPEIENERLQVIKYHPCIALLVLLDGPSAIPAPGGMKLERGPIAWIADNTQKGISSKATAVTIHASADYSHQDYDSNHDQIGEQLLLAAKPWLGEHVRDWQIHKWRYSQPKLVYPERFMEIPRLPDLYFAGDAFGGPRVEGAALSGIALGGHLCKKTIFMEN